MASNRTSHSALDLAMQERGWILFEDDPALHRWIRGTLPAARRTLDDPAYRQWWRHGDTWFVGVNALENGPDGAVPGGLPFTGRALSYLARTNAFRDLPLDRAQVSVCFPGYPARSTSESDASHRYRRQRDAAHIDGLLRHGPDRRRYLGEHHAYILGIPMVAAPAEAAPFVVWEGSHRIAREFFHRLLAGREPGAWQDLDLTDSYHELRRDIFRRCPRRVIHTLPGQCYLVHRMALHGMAPWQARQKAGPDGRMVCYFRPEMPEPLTWLTLP